MQDVHKRLTNSVTYADSASLTRQEEEHDYMYKYNIKCLDMIFSLIFMKAR